MFLSILRRQHGEIEALVETNNKLLGKAILNAKQILSNTAILSGKLVAHLSMEDKVLYPRLLRSNNEEIVNVAKRFITEMGHLQKVFNNYKNNWSNEKKIKMNEEEFKIATKKVYDALLTRIKSENEQLYPYLESNRF